ncbi:MAG: diacylglycerol kinase family lipid kinase [Lachnospiraceae bacterium]|nr:diacylglycerol kinase family lipid kinase [Lachnospiraceae bacterium]
MWNGYHPQKRIDTCEVVKMYHIIVNPASKTGKGKLLWADIEPVLIDKGVDFKVYFSKRPGHVIELVKNITGLGLAGSPDSIIDLIVLGGDGTLNEALQGVADFDRVRIGYIPTGSSNDLARDLKLSADPIKCLNNILSCKEPSKMDIGCIEYINAPGELSRDHKKAENIETKRFFDVSMGIGYDAAVCEEALTSSMKKALNRIGLGKLIYLCIALKQLIKTKTVDVTMVLDDDKKIELKGFLFATCMIHQYEGGGFMFCPGADYTDGVLDICAASGVSKLRVLFGLPKALKGKHFGIKGIERYSASKVSIVSSSPCWIHTDGEVKMKNDSIVITCKKQALQLLK